MARNIARFPILPTATSHQTILEYKQVENIRTCQYQGRQIVTWQLLGLVDSFEGIDM